MNSYELNEAQNPSCNRKSPNPETLRDRIAIAVLQGLMLRYKEPGYSDMDATADAYSIADDMMKAREF